MKTKFKINADAIKGILATILFALAYTFVFSLTIKLERPLSFIANAGFNFAYVIISMLIAGLPYILCGYLIMIARNNYDDLDKKNKNLSLMILSLLLTIFLIIALLQFIFAYRSIYTSFIMMNYPLLRSVLFVELGSLELFIAQLVTCFIIPIYIYLGGKLRIKVLEKEDVNG